MTEHEHKVQGTPSLCIQYVNGSLLEVVRELFSSPDNVFDFNAKRYTWTGDSKTSTILIETNLMWKPEDIQKRPAVLVKRGNWAFSVLGLGNQTQFVEHEGYVELEGCAMLKGGHSFMCLGTTQTEAEIIASEVNSYLLAFQHLIMDRLCVGRFFLAGVSEAKKFEESKEHFVVQVDVIYESQLSWYVSRQTPYWRKVSLDTIAT